MMYFDPNDDPFWSDFLAGADELQYVSRGVRLLGTYASLLTVAVAVSALSLTLLQQNVYYSNWNWEWIVTSVTVALAVGAAFCLVRLERMLRRGDVLFEVMTEELQYRLSVAPDPVFKRAPQRGRVAMKDYSHARALPFLPARSGPAILLLVNFLCVFLVLFVASLRVNTLY